MPVTRQAAQALNTDIHIVDGTDDDSKNVMLFYYAVHQNHLVSWRLYDESEWCRVVKMTFYIFRICSLVVSKYFVSAWNLHVGPLVVYAVAANKPSRLGCKVNSVLLLCYSE